MTHRLRARFVLLAALAAGVHLSASARSAAPHAEAVPLPAPNAARLDGDPTPEMWAHSPVVEDFIERAPTEGGKPAERTTFQVAYNATTLFVRVQAFDTEPGRIVGYLTRRDADSPSDWIRVLIDSYHDRRTAYEFAVNPAGVKQDRYWFNDNSRDDSWDAVWDVTVARSAKGWSAEFRIPFSQLRFTPTANPVFGFAVSRDIGRLNETSTWPLLARSATGYVSQFGELDGLSIPASPKRLELVPYTVTSLTRQPTDGNPLLHRSAPGASVGMDLKYALTPGLTLTSTINPDFGQVEADPAVVNLTAFETFFAERRPFFVEGSGNFQFDLDCNDGSCSGLFYSRRIGRAPQGTGDLPSGDAVYTNAPAQTTILGAGKLTGRVGKYSVGVLEAVTARETASVIDGAAGSQSTVEPAASYAVARVRREFADQSTLGVMMTSTRRAITGDLATPLARDAYAGGVDWDLRFGGRYSLNGYWAASSVRGSPDAIAAVQESSRHYFQRPGLESTRLDPTRTALDGTSARLSVGKIGGQRVHFNSTVSFKSPGFDINDLGYFRRADVRAVSNWLQIRSDVPTRWFRSRMINFNQYASWNFDGDLLQSGGNVNAHAVFANNWSIGGGFNVNARGFDDRLSRGGPGGYVQGYDEGWWHVDGDNRRMVSLNYSGGAGRDGYGSRWLEVSPELTVRPMAALSVTAGVHYNRNIVDAQWIEQVTDPADHYVFGHLDQTTVSLTGRVNYTLTPRLSIQLYAQPFVSGGAYTNVRELVDGRSDVYASRYAAFSPLRMDENPDFNVKSFRTTNVLRWEYTPGSTLFVVWQQARENDAVPGGFSFGRDARDIFGVPPHNVFLVKVAYWLNY
ncbi:MAG: DUF5916 domain-containing protein [Betaproteobacteria bacterium]